MPFVEFTRVVAVEFKDKGLRRVPTKRAGYSALYIFSIFDQQIKMLLPLVGKELLMNNQKSKDLLGMRYERDLKQTMVEMVASMIELGILKTSNKTSCTIF